MASQSSSICPSLTISPFQPSAPLPCYWSTKYHANKHWTTKYPPNICKTRGPVIWFIWTLGSHRDRKPPYRFRILKHLLLFFVISLSGQVTTIYLWSTSKQNKWKLWGKVNLLLSESFLCVFLALFLFASSQQRKERFRARYGWDTSPGLCSYKAYTTEPPESLKELRWEKCSHCSLTHTAISYMWKVRCLHHWSSQYPCRFYFLKHWSIVWINTLCLPTGVSEG